jgi:protein TonB
MFEALEATSDAGLLRRRMIAAVVAAATLTGIAGGAVVIGARAKAAPPPTLQKKSVTVSFRPPPPRIEAPPPPPPVVRARPARPSVTAAPAALVAPSQAPTERPPEAEAAAAVEEKFVAVGGTGDGTSPQSIPVEEAPAPINLPEDATPPVPFDGNLEPSYPADARAAGREGLVILKIAIDEGGQVFDIQVLRGEEPFVAAAVQVVRGWRYQPALVESRPTAVYRVVKVPFRIRS